MHSQTNHYSFILGLRHLHSGTTSPKHVATLAETDTVIFTPDRVPYCNIRWSYAEDKINIITSRDNAYLNNFKISSVDSQ